MSKKISYKNRLPMDVEERIRLKTIQGKVGYKIKKFQIISQAPGAASHELVGKIRLTPDPNVGPTVDFSDGDLLACSFQMDQEVGNDVIIVDTEIFNQDIFVQIGSANSSSVEANYYIELEAMSITDIEATMLTLKNIRSVTSG